LLFCGDIMLSRNVRLEIEQHRISPWNYISPRLKSSDLVIGNLEGTVGVFNNQKDSSRKGIIFDIPKSYLNLLKDAGFTSLSLENNHINDMGISNKDSTIFDLSEAGIQPLHSNNSPHFFRFDNIIISVIAINMVADKEGLCEKIPSVEAKQKLRLAKSLSGFVIVTIHWGSELLDWPNKSQRAAAEWLVDNGADLIIGHHPHVIQAPEIIKGKPVFFSLGNHIFDQKYSVTREGLMVECIFKNGKIEYRGITTHSVKDSFFPEITGEVRYDFPEMKIAPCISYYDIDIFPVSSDNGSEGRIILEGYSGGKKLWQTPAISLVSISPADFDEMHNYLFTLERHYSSIDEEYGTRPYVYNMTRAGLSALWRGSALSRPLIDAALSPDKKYLIALHRGDSFINPDSTNCDTRLETYKWNGFGFSGYKDSGALEYARQYYESIQTDK
jgi:hypothetical protein